MECGSTDILRVRFPYAIEIAHDAGVHAGASSYHNIRGRTRSRIMKSVGTMECSSTNIRSTKSTVPVRHRDCTERNSARRREFVPQDSGAYAVAQHEECRHDGAQYQYTWILFPYAIEIALNERVHAGASLYHKILGRTRSYRTRCVGTMECSNSNMHGYCWTYSHHCQIADTNPSKIWNGEFRGFRICVGWISTTGFCLVGFYVPD